MNRTSLKSHTGRKMSALYLSFFVFAIAFAIVASAHAQSTLVKLSTDTFHDSDAQHRTEVEPDTFAWGSTIVTAFQVARIFGGGGADVGFATSTNAGKTGPTGDLPGITIYQGGTNSAASDAAVAYDALHNVWLISTLPIGNNTSVAVSRSTDGITWSNPIAVTGSSSADKNWIVCDNKAPSPFYDPCHSGGADTARGACG